MNISEFSKSDQATYLAILFIWKQKKLSNDLGEHDDLGGVPALDCIMSGVSGMENKNFLSEQLGDLVRWGVLILTQSEDEWQQLVCLRKSKSLSDWYRQDYLKSVLWKELRSIVLGIDDNECQLCQKRAHCVHHVGYDDFIMRGLDLRYLWSLCNKCHEDVEFDGGRKMSIFQSSSRLESMYKQRFAASV